MKQKITGIMIYYYFVCNRKLWYYINGISMEQDNELVAVGKSVDENTYNRQEKHFNINNEINIDYVTSTGVVHEVKKSRSIEEAGIWQVKYYLSYLKKRGLNNIVGKIDYPLLRQTVEVVLKAEDEQKLEQISEEITELAEHDIPGLRKKGICKKCAYVDLCLV